MGNIYVRRQNEYADCTECQKKRSLIYQAYTEAISCGFGRGDDGLDEWQRESIKNEELLNMKSGLLTHF